MYHYQKLTYQSATIKLREVLIELPEENIVLEALIANQRLDSLNQHDLEDCDDDPILLLELRPNLDWRLLD